MVSDAPDRYPGEAGDVPDLTALDALTPGFAADDVGDGADQPVFTVSNPTGSVTVSAHLDGHVARIRLSPRVTGMTETELAEEVVVLAELASQDAKSAQYEAMLADMREQGHDDHATREFLQRDLDLPTPEQARARRAEVFSTRYAGSHE